MWRTYFSRRMIYGIDIFDKRAHDERRIKTFCGSQADYNFLADVAAITGRLDIVIDDGSHRSSDVIASFEFLFPFLNQRGIYAIEDTHVQTKTIGYFKRLARERRYVIYFYPDLIIIEKNAS